MLREFLLALAVSVDTLFAAMGCTMDGIRIPRRYAWAMSAVGTCFLGCAILGSAWLSQWIPPAMGRIGGCVILCGMGIFQLCRSALHRTLARREAMCLHWKGIGIVIRIALDECEADADGSKSLSLHESLTLAAALSLDSLATGFGACIGGGGAVFCLLWSFLLGILAVVIGCSLGNRLAKRSGAWAGSVLLILLGVMQLFGGG